VNVSSYPYNSQASPPPSNFVQNSFGEYFLSYDAAGDSVDVYLDANNPAWQVYYYLSAADKAMLPSYTYGAGSSDIYNDIDFTPTSGCP
jgi:hypothetical protein